MQKYYITLILLIMLCGCAVLPQPMSLKQIENRVDKDRQDIFANQEPISAPLTIYDAMARAIKYNLDHRLKLMETALASQQADVSTYDMLPKVATSAGYSFRSNESGAYSVSLLTGRQSLEPSTSQDRTTQTFDIGMMWNVLDFGVSYLRARQQADSLLIAEERRRKVLQNIIQDVRYAYCRAASSERLLTEMSSLLERAKTALERSKKISDERLRPPKESLEYQRELLENIRLLWGLIQSLSPAKTELATLMNLSPGTKFQVIEPNWNAPEIPVFSNPIENLERLAMAYRPELREEDYRASISALEARKAILEMLPGLNLNFGYNYNSNDFLYHKSWWDAGTKVSLNIFKLVSGPAAYRVAQSQQEVDHTRRLALSVAVLTQVHLSRQGYGLALEEYKVSKMLDEVNNKLDSQTAAAGSVGKADELTVIRSATNALVAKMRHHLAYTELQNASGRIYNSIGLDPMPISTGSASVSTLSKSLEKSFAEWGRLLNEPRPIRMSDVERAMPGTGSITIGQMEIQEKQAPENIEGLIEENLKPEVKPVQEPGKKVSIRVDVADVYTEPSVNSKVKIQAFMGEHYRMTDWSPKGWLKLELNDGSAGWIPTVMIRPVTDGEKQPKADQVVLGTKAQSSEPAVIRDQPLKEGEESPKERQAVTEERKDESFAPAKDNQEIREIQVLITTIKKANIRSGPAPSFDVKRVEDAGVRFKSTGVIGDEWYRIQMEDGSIGWIHKSVISVLTGI